MKRPSECGALAPPGRAAREREWERERGCGRGQRLGAVAVGGSGGAGTGARGSGGRARPGGRDQSEAVATWGRDSVPKTCGRGPATLGRPWPATSSGADRRRPSSALC